MNFKSRVENLVSGFELVTVLALQVLVIVLIVASTIVLYVLAVRALYSEMVHIATVGELLETEQRAVAGILVVVLALELLATLTAYFREHQVRLEVILIVAIIAVSRQVILVEVTHTSATTMFGLSTLVISLAIGYFLVKRSQRATTPPQPGDEDE